jgi:hypothetical protein
MEVLVFDGVRSRKSHCFLMMSTGCTSVRDFRIDKPGRFQNHALFEREGGASLRIATEDYSFPYLRKPTVVLNIQPVYHWTKRIWLLVRQGPSSELLDSLGL